MFDDDMRAILGADFGSEGGAFLNGSTTSIPGVFDDGHVPVQNGEGVEMLVPQTTYTCATADVPDIAEDQPLLIKGVIYKVKAWEHDGGGMTTLYLEAPQP